MVLKSLKDTHNIKLFVSVFLYSAPHSSREVSGTRGLGKLIPGRLKSSIPFPYKKQSMNA